MTSKPVPILYFAYADDLDKKRMKLQAPESRPRVTAVLPNYRLIFVGWSRITKSGVATVRGAQGSKVSGGVYEITEGDLRRLDAAHGYPREANRINITVFTEDGDALKAITYIRTGQEAEGKPSLDYLETIKRGYRDWGIV
jgi:gamma-glutamylcyclotransferase (GGCT)/AIG2-like uncharacterized protein YtfP